jgi:hypothetical protein
MPIKSTIKTIFKFKKLSLKLFENMIFSTASFDNSGFSYLLLFKEEYHSDIARILKEGPEVFDVVSFVIQNDHSCLVQEKIKPVLHHETNSVLIEDIGNEPSNPIKRTGNGWDDEPPETDQEFQERLNQYNIEKDKWFKVKTFLYFVGKNYRHYKFE